MFFQSGGSKSSPTYLGIAALARLGFMLDNKFAATICKSEESVIPSLYNPTWNSTYLFKCSLAFITPASLAFTLLVLSK